MTAQDVISNTLATMPQRELMDVLAHMKAFVITHPDQARALLVAHPQLAYALFQALLLNKIVDSSILTRMLSATTQSTPAGAPPPPSSAGPSRTPVPSNGTSAPPSQPPFQPTPPYGYSPAPGMMPPYMAGGMPPPPPGAMFPPPMQPPYYRPPPPPMGMMSTPPPQQSNTKPPLPTPPTSQTASMQVPGAPEMTESQRAALMQMFTLKPEDIERLPEQEKAAIQQLRAMYMNTMGGGPPV
ncbi:hypothetical protein PM082_009057 [Marasmius tenuissimus]|nr:hypothetical protein PM082_009057 [Marasmius tenuissimus]